MNKENRDDYIVISKEKMVNYFFTSILALALVVFIVLMGKAIIVGFNSSSDDLVENIDMDLVSYYKDDFLNITYGIPGGNWGMAEIEDTSGIENVCIASAGEDGVFDIKEDTLAEEVISSVCLLSGTEGEQNFHQFMSFTFRPTTELKGKDFVDYCIKSFERDMTEAEGGSSTGEFKITDTIEVDDNSVMLKMISYELIEKEVDGKKVSEKYPTYYTQYIRKIGKNIAIATFGSINEDNTVDDYMIFFLKSIFTDEDLLGVKDSHIIQEKTISQDTFNEANESSESEEEHNHVHNEEVVENEELEQEEIETTSEEVE